MLKVKDKITKTFNSVNLLNLYSFMSLLAAWGVTVW